MSNINNKKIRVIIVDDEKLFRRGLRYILHSHQDIEVLAFNDTANTEIYTLETLKRLPQIILLDLKMDDLNGVETTKILQKTYPKIKIAILSLYYSPEMVRFMIDLGVSAFFKKTIEPDELITAINKIAENGSYLIPHVISIMQKEEREKNYNPGKRLLKERLTQREIEVLKLICEQLTNAEIAKKLFLSIRTIDGYRNSLLQKTNSKNTAGLVLFAISHNFFDFRDLDIQSPGL